MTWIKSWSVCWRVNTSRRFAGPDVTSGHQTKIRAEASPEDRGATSVAGRKSMRRILMLTVVVLVAMVLALAGPYATYAAPVFSFSTIDAGGSTTEAFGVNTAGQIVGAVFFDNEEWGDFDIYGFLWESGTSTLFSYGGPGGSCEGKCHPPTFFHGINDAGQIVGYRGLGADDGFLKDGAGTTFFFVPGAYSTLAHGINIAGQIVGSSYDATGRHGFLKDADTFTIIDAPGASGTEAYGINGVGQIVGWFVDATGYHGFLKDGDTFTTIEVPGATNTWASGINDAGQIVGSFIVEPLEAGLLAQGFLAVPTENNNASISIAPNRVSFRIGDSLTVSVGVENPGLPAVVDFYFDVVLPDGDTLVFFTNLEFASGVGSLAKPATLQPIVAGIDLTTPFTYSQPTFFGYSWTGGEPPGGYVLFVAAVKSGALADNSIDAGDIVAVSTAAVSFAP